jgi:predicted NBD/HSP70 family sugar kinase
MDTVSSETFRRQLGLASLNWANDVKAAAMAEYQWGGLQGAKCGLYVNLGTGLSAGAVIQGEPLNGAHGAALEIGYLLPSTQYVPGHRSGAAPLEDLISGRALGERATRLCGQHLTATDVLATIESMSPAGNPQVGDLQLLAEEFIDHLCRAVVNLAISLDVDVISVGGGVAVASRSFLPALRAALDEYVPFPPKLTASPAPNDLSMRGALLLAYKAAGLGVPNLNQRSGPRPARYTTAAPAA